MLKARTPKEVQESLVALSANRDFVIICKWLEDNLKDIRANNDTLTGIDLTRSQGAAITIAKILKTVEEAE